MLKNVSSGAWLVCLTELLLFSISYMFYIALIILQTFKTLFLYINIYFCRFKLICCFLVFFTRPPTDISLKLWQEPTWVGSERPARWPLCKLCHSKTPAWTHGLLNKSDCVVWISWNDISLYCDVSDDQQDAISHFPIAESSRAFQSLALHI